MTRALAALALLATAACGYAGEGNRLTYLDDDSPYYPSRTFPKLITPQWVGEAGVDAVVILAIDDMRGHEQWERYLRPILNRLKKIDGRAPVSIMTCQIDPRHPHLQTWLKEGLSLECHTLDHPCPLLQKGSFEKAKATYDGCVDLMNKVPGNKPVAFRTPCCDSQNTVSPRFFAEIFNKRTPAGNFLQVDSSVFTLFTGNDPELPRELVYDEDGRERFRKYFPTRSPFVNYIEDYPYPYVVNRLCWEFPCMTPSDWQGQNLFRPGNPITLRDWKAALDCTVIKKGVFSAVFHPYNWILPDQVVDFIDYAQTKYGKRVKFLTFKEALERLNRNLLGGRSLRDRRTGQRTDVQLAPRALGTDVYIELFEHDGHGGRVFGNLVEFAEGPEYEARTQKEYSTVLPVRLADELIYAVANDRMQALLRWSANARKLQRVRVMMPAGAFVQHADHDYGLRFTDLDGDGNDDVVFANEKEYGVYLFTDLEQGWSRKISAGKAGEPGALPPITINGKNNGFFVHGRALCWQNEHTDMLPGLIQRITFNELLKDIEPEAKSPEASLKSIQTAPGFRVELMAAEPLVQDPIAFAFGPDGKLWVVEMGDYPSGIDGKGKFGGKIKYLESTRGDGKYDRATIFLDNLGFPTGVLPWRNGILVTCAPDIFFVENVNGKPGKKEVLFTGFGQGNQQHRVNTLAWGLDNWIYVANGDSGGKITSKKTGKTIDISGRDLRIRPDTGEMEAQSGQTQYGRSRDDWGNWFGGNNANPMWHYVLDDRYRRRNPHASYTDVRRHVSIAPGVAPVFPISRTLARFNDPRAANRFTSACSPIVYRDELYYTERGGVAGAESSKPRSEAGNRGSAPGAAGTGTQLRPPEAWTFVSEPVHNLIHREIMTPLGVTFRSRRAPGEERAEFLASSDNWFRPTMIQTGPDGCLWVADMYRAVIEHPEWIPPDWQKRLDLRAGHDRGRIYRVVPVHVKPRPIPRLDRLDTAGLVAALDSPNGWQRDMAQMMLFWRNDPDSATPLARLAISSKRPETRVQALSTLPEIRSHILTAMTVRRAFHDPHPAVRRHAVRIWEGRLDKASDVNDEMLKLVDDPDPHVRMQLACTLGAWQDSKTAAVLGKLAVRDAATPFMLDAVCSSINKANFDGVIQSVLSQPNPPASVMPTLLTMAARMKHPVSSRVLDFIFKSLDDPFGRHWLGVLADLLESLDIGSTGVSAEKWSAVFARARNVAVDEQAEPHSRAAALRLLGREPKQRGADIKLLRGFLKPQAPTGLQSAAITSLGRIGEAEVLLKAWKGVGPGPRAWMLAEMARREDGIQALLDALELRRVDASEIDAAARQFLTAHKNPAIRQRAAKLLAGSIDPDREKVVNAFRPALTLKGDAARGREQFAKSCHACHKLNGFGNDVGPDLTALAGRPPEYLMIAILDPNRAVEARYVNYIAETKDGRSFSGVLVTEDSTSITLVGTDGWPHTIRRTSLESLTSTGRSAMPEGLEKDWKPQDLADLLSYLRAGAPAANPK